MERTRPEWAKALIVAEMEHDKSEIMTDYFATNTSRVVGLAWSKHDRDVFSEMRKAAATFEETKHLGPGCDVWTARVVLDIPAPGYFMYNGIAYHDGNHDHNPEREPRSFTTESEAREHVATFGPLAPCWYGETLVNYRWEVTRTSVEHREKWSMGAGYYLKASGRYTNGWKVRKLSGWSLEHIGESVEIAGEEVA